MIVKAFTLLILVSYAIGELCVNYDFEQGFYELFSDNGVCNSLPLWFIGKYEDLNMIGENGSTTFITPSSQWAASCASSFVFSMKSGGTIEVDIYMERSHVNDQIQVFVSQVVAGGGSFVRAKAESGVSGYSANGRQTLKVTLNSTDNYEGFISTVGKAAPESVVLVDAFRYTPPHVDDTYCQDPKNVLNPFSNVNTNAIFSRKTTRTTRRTTTTKKTTTTKRTTTTKKTTTTRWTTASTTTTNETTTYNTTTPNYNTTSPVYSTTLPTVTSRPPYIIDDRPASSATSLAPLMTMLLSLTVLSALCKLPS